MTDIEPTNEAKSKVTPSQQSEHLRREKLRPHLGHHQTFTARIGHISNHVMLRHVRLGDDYICDHIWVRNVEGFAGMKSDDWISFRARPGYYVKGLRRFIKSGDTKVEGDIGLFGIGEIRRIERQRQPGRRDQGGSANDG